MVSTSLGQRAWARCGRVVRPVWPEDGDLSKEVGRKSGRTLEAIARILDFYSKCSEKPLEG